MAGPSVRARTLALAGRGGAPQLLQQAGDQAHALYAVHAGIAQHHRHQAAQRVLRRVLQVVLVRGNLVHQALRAHCRVQRMAGRDRGLRAG